MTSAGYRCVNYFELCRLCTSSAGTKTNIFSDEGRKIDLIGKIAVCLPVVIDEQDKLPKILCANCLNQVESIAKFRETCINAQTMLESCLNSAKLRNGGKVYIKDISSKKLTSPVGGSQVALKTIGTTTIRQAQPKPKIVTQTTNNSTVSSDFLSSIIQAVGIHNVDDGSELQEMPQLIQQQPQQQYTITLDGQTMRNQIHYKIEPAGQAISLQPSQTISSNNSSSVEEFLKLKPNNQITIKKKVIGGNRMNATGARLKINSNANTITASPVQRIAKQSEVRVLSQNKCYVPITIKDENSDQQIVAQIDANELMPGGFLKLQSAVSSKNQHIVSTQYSTQNFIDSKSIFTTASGHNVTIHQPSPTKSSSNLTQQQLMPPPPAPVQIIHLQHINNQDMNSSDLNPPLVQLTTLRNVETSAQSHPLPSKSGITIQRVKSEAMIPKKPITQQPAVRTAKPSQSSTVRTLPTLHAIKSISNTNKSKLVKGTPITNSKSVSANSTKQQLMKKGPPRPVLVSTAKSTTTTTTTTPQATTSPAASSANNSEELPSCGVCDKVFKRKEHLNQHMKLHLGLRPFCCTEPGCNKSFSRKEHLMRHVVSHTGKKMFNCEFCQKMFSRKDNLNKHKRSHDTKGTQNIVYTITQVKENEG